MEYTPHWKRLWMTINGKREHIGTVGASTGINLVKNQLTIGIAMYKPYSDSSYQLCVENLPGSDEACILEILHRISISMNLDSAVTWALICNYLHFECYVDIANIGDIDKYIKNQPKFDVDIWQFYTLERMFLLKTLLCIVENCRNKEHRFFELYRKFVDDVSMKTIRENLFKQFSLTSKNVDLDTSNSFLSISHWIERNIREQLQILFIILTTLAHEKCDVNDFIELLKTFKEQNYVFKSYTWDETPIAKSPSLASIRKVEVAIILASLEHFWHNPEMWYFRFNEVGSEMDELMKNWKSSALLLAWVALHLSVPVEVPMPMYELQVQSYLHRAFESNAFLDLHEIVSNVLFKDCLAGLTVKIAIFTIFEVFCIKLGSNTISHNEGMVNLLEKLLRVPEIVVAWHEGSDEGAKSFYNIVTSLFPLYYHPLSLCVRSLIGVNCDTASVVNGLNNLQLFAERTFIERRVERGIKIYALETTYRPFNNDLVVFEKGSKISYEIVNKEEVAMIHGRYSYFRVLLHCVDMLIRQIQCHDTDPDMVKAVENGYRIVLDIMRIQPNLVSANTDVDKLIKYSYYLLNVVTKARDKNVNILAVCFEILVDQFDVRPKEVMKHIHAIKFLPCLLKDSYSIEDFSSVHILSVVSINEYTANLFTSSACDLICIYVELVKKSIKSRLFVDEIILPGLMFLITKIFPKFSTQFTGDNEKTRNVCCQLISLCHLVLEQDRTALSEKELLYVDSVINLFATKKLYAATLASLFRFRNVQLEFILIVETNYACGPLLELVESVKKGLQCISYILNYLYLNKDNYNNNMLLEHYLWEFSPNGSILSHIAEYKLNSFDNEIPRIVWNVLTNFALITRRPLLQTFRVGSREIRQWILQSLYDPLLSEDVKVAIINMIKTCIYEQASMIVAFFNIEDPQLEIEKDDSVSKYMSDYISNIERDATILSEPLQLSILELFHVIWKTNKKHIIKRLTDGELFWKLMSIPLLKPQRIPLHADVLSFEIFILELCHTQGNIPENYTAAIANMFEASNQFVESWIDRAKSITHVENLNTPRPGQLSPGTVVVTVLKKFLLVSKRFYPVYEFRWNTHALEKECLETVLYCSVHTENRQLLTQWADLSLVFSTHRNRSETEMLEILECALKILSVYVRLYRGMNDTDRLAISTLMFVLLKDSFDVISRHHIMIERFLLPIIKLFYFEYTIIFMVDKEKQSNETFYHQWVLILKMINLFLQMDCIGDFKNVFTTFVFLGKVFDVIELIIKNKWSSKIAEITTASLIYYAESKMDDHFNSYFQHICYNFVSTDIFYFDMNSLRRGVIPENVLDHWRLYTQVIRLNEILLRKRGSFVVDRLFFFVKTHQPIMRNAILSVTVVLTESNVLLTCHVLRFVHDLLRYLGRWPTDKSMIFEPILNSINQVLTVGNHILLFPTIIMFKFESGTFRKIPHSEIPLNIFVSIINRYLEILTWGLMCFNQSNPPFYKLLDVYQDRKFTVRAKYDLHFPSLTGSIHGYLSFNILFSILQFLCQTLTEISMCDRETYGNRVYPPELKDYVALLYPWDNKGEINSVVMMFEDVMNETYRRHVNLFSHLKQDILLETLSALGTFLATQLFLSTRDASLGYDEIYYMKRQLCTEMLCFYKFVSDHVTKVSSRSTSTNTAQQYLCVDVNKICCDEEKGRIPICSIDNAHFIILTHWFKHVCQLVYSSKFDEMLSQLNVKRADSAHLFQKLTKVRR